MMERIFDTIKSGLLLLAAAAVLSSSSCGEKEQPKSQDDITLDKTEISVSSDAATATVNVTASGDWGVGSGATDWCTVSPSGGLKGNATVTVTIAENFTRSDRETTLNFRCGSVRKTVAVKQEKKEEAINVPDGYSLVWQDEFNDASVDGTKWRFENWMPGHVNNELQRYVTNGELDGNKTAFCEDGVLNIRAMKYSGQVISARMNTRASWEYGYMEASIKLPKGKGTWPAFWMMPDDQSLGWPKCGEIDIMEEVGVDPNITSSSIHCESYNHVKGTQKTASRKTSGAEDEFHTYALEWTPTYIKTYVDGTLLLNFANDGAGNVSTWPFNKKFYITLNLAWGGDWGGYAGVDESKLPATMQVDYVRVFQKK